MSERDAEPAGPALSWAQELVEAAPDPIIVIDQGGAIVFANGQTERLFGYPRSELLGQPIEHLVPERFRHTHHAKRASFQAHPSFRPMGSGLDLTARCRDGREIPVEISLAPLHTADGVFISAAIRDITERRRTQEALRDARDQLEARVHARTAELEHANPALQTEMADRLKAEGALRQAQKMEAVGQLTGGIAHDFNNLLTVIMGNLQMLLRQTRDNALASELAQAAFKAARRGSELNRTLLAFSRRQHLAPAAVDLNELVTHMGTMLQRTLGEQINIQLGLAPGLPRALADPGQLETAVLNLAVNARDAMPDGGTLSLDTASVVLDSHYTATEVDITPGRYLRLTVSDSGHGMDAATVARACEPFFTTKEVGQGSGLGLAMVYGFVKQSGGHIKIYSEPGLGTSIKLFLPEVQRDADTPTDAPDSPTDVEPRGGHETLLIVEDEEAVRNMVCRVLESLGYRILVATQGNEALELLQTHPEIALLFTDVVLPGGLRGPDIARHARSLRPDLPVLFTSGYTGTALPLQDSTDTPPFPLITKPYPIEELARMIRGALEGGG